MDYIYVVFTTIGIDEFPEDITFFKNEDDAKKYASVIATRDAKDLYSVSKDLHGNFDIVLENDPSDETALIVETVVIKKYPLN